jgi:hypothetical protein
MRPRKSNGDLPKNVYERRGKFYLVRRGKWLPLGCDRRSIAGKVKSYALVADAGEEAILKRLKYCVSRARQNSRQRRKMEFSVTAEYVVSIARAQGMRCALTRAPFSMDTAGPFEDRPYAPSIDRIDCKRGYVEGNVRIVCVAVNFAINRWGDGVLHTLFEHMAMARVLDTPAVSNRQHGLSC